MTIEATFEQVQNTQAEDRYYQRCDIPSYEAFEAWVRLVCDEKEADMRLAALIDSALHVCGSPNYPDSLNTLFADLPPVATTLALKHLAACVK